MLLLLLLWLAGPSDATSLLQRGLFAMQKGQSAEARTVLEQAAQADSQNAYVWSSLAEVYRRLHDAQKSVAAAERAEKLGANNPMVCHALAMYYSEADQPRKAAKLEQRYAESSKADSGALARTANLYLAAGDLDPALAMAQRALQKQTSPVNEGVLGRVLLAQDLPQAALPHLQTAWTANETDEGATFDYVNALLRVQDFTVAADTVSAALKGHPADSQLVLLLGVARYGQRRFEDAIQSFQEVIRLNPEIEQPYIFLGRLLAQAGPHLPSIIDADRTWATRNPGHPQAQLQLAKALLQQDHANAEAGLLLRKSILLNGKDWESRYQLGLFLESKREFKEAAEELQASITLNPNESMSHYHLARVYDRLGEASKAEAERAIHTQLTGAVKDRR